MVTQCMVVGETSENSAWAVSDGAKPWIRFYHLRKQLQVRNKDLKVNLDQDTLISNLSNLLCFLVLKNEALQVLKNCWVLFSFSGGVCCLAPGLSCRKFTERKDWSTQWLLTEDSRRRLMWSIWKYSCTGSSSRTWFSRSGMELSYQYCTKSLADYGVYPLIPLVETIYSKRLCFT